MFTFMNVGFGYVQKNQWDPKTEATIVGTNFDVLPSGWRSKSKQSKLIKHRSFFLTNFKRVHATGEVLPKLKTDNQLTSSILTMNFDNGACYLYVCYFVCLLVFASSSLLHAACLLSISKQVVDRPLV